MEIEDTQQSPATATGRAVTIGVWLVVMLVGYVASVGPACWLREGGCITQDQFITAYLPLIWLYNLDRESWFALRLDWWCKWWQSR